MKPLWGAFLVALCFLAVPVSAGTDHYFEALYDVPVMPGLEELPDQAMLFDKPDGRIASVVAATKTVKEADIRRFYGDTLAQMGWRKSAENQYVRRGDRLSMEIAARPPLVVVHFTLEPANP
ncbi:MAG TPA: hypothetical protein VFS88_04315 [Micavibrio sp.]|nr:hypothetical protein [Micavibrio sp.]